MPIAAPSERAQRTLSSESANSTCFAPPSLDADRLVQPLHHCPPSLPPRVDVRTVTTGLTLDLDQLHSSPLSPRVARVAATQLDRDGLVEHPVDEQQGQLERNERQRIPDRVALGDTLGRAAHECLDCSAVPQTVGASEVGNRRLPDGAFEHDLRLPPNRAGRETLTARRPQRQMSPGGVPEDARPL